MVSLRARLNSWRGFRRLPASEQWLSLQALPLLLVTIAGLHLFGFKRWQSVLWHLARMCPRRHEQERVATAQQALTVARGVRRAAVHGPFRGTCLAEALVVSSLLRRYGIDGELQIGVRRSAMDIEAHAWVDVAGHTITGGEDLKKTFTKLGTPISTAGYL